MSANNEVGIPLRRPGDCRPDRAVSGVVVPARDEPVPAVATPWELTMRAGGQSSLAAIEEVARISRRIAELRPQDTETYRLMLSIRAKYVESAECVIQQQMRGHC